MLGEVEPGGAAHLVLPVDLVDVAIGPGLETLVGDLEQLGPFAEADRLHRTGRGAGRVEAVHALQLDEGLRPLGLHRRGPTRVRVDHREGVGRRRWRSTRRSLKGRPGGGRRLALLQASSHLRQPMAGR